MMGVLSVEVFTDVLEGVLAFELALAPLSNSIVTHLNSGWLMYLNFELRVRLYPHPTQASSMITDVS